MLGEIPRQDVCGVASHAAVRHGRRLPASLAPGRCWSESASAPGLIIGLGARSAQRRVDGGLRDDRSGRWSRTELIGRTASCSGGRWWRVTDLRSPGRTRKPARHAPPWGSLNGGGAAGPRCRRGAQPPAERRRGGCVVGGRSRLGRGEGEHGLVANCRLRRSSRQSVAERVRTKARGPLGEWRWWRAASPGRRRVEPEGARRRRVGSSARPALRTGCARGHPEMDRSLARERPP